MARILVNPPVPVPKPESTRGRKLVALKERDVIKMIQWEIDFRFIRECEALEIAGRVSSREDLERALYLDKGALSTVRGGARGISPCHIRLLFELYRADVTYILFGQRTNTALTDPLINGKRIDVYKGYYHRYNATARWKIGQRAEAFPAHYALDPLNEQWRAPGTKNIEDLKGGADSQQ